MYLIGNDTLQRALEKEGVTMVEIQAHIRAIDCLKTAHARLRDEFAMACITGTLPGSGFSDEELKEYAHWAYRMADAMLHAREAR